MARIKKQSAVPLARPASAMFEMIERRVLLSATTASLVGYLPDYEYSAARLTTLTNAKFEGLTQVDYFSVLPNANGLLPGTTVGSLSNTTTTTSGGYSLTGSTSALSKLVTAAHADGVKVVVVIGGGGSQSSSLTTVVQTSATWQNFATSVQQFATAHGIDGVDLDWEPASLASTDTANYGNMIATLRATNPSLLLSAAVNSEKLSVSGGPNAYVLNATAMRNLTTINVMAYDLEPGNTSPTAEAESNLAGWGTYAAANGISKTELIFGMPFYGTSGTTWANTIAEQYSQLVSQNGSLPSPSANSVVISGVTWNYNGPTTIGAKTAYALDNGYGGVTAWEIGQDYFTSSGGYDNTYSLLPQFQQSTVANTGTISGTIATSSAAPVAGQTVYIDTNNNGQLDAGEPSSTTDASGAYSFSNVLIGTYQIRAVLANGYTQTSPTAGTGLSAVVTAGHALAENFVVTPPLTTTALTLINNGPATTNATQALSLTATVTGGVPDGETIALKDAGNNNAVIATAILTGGTATFALPAGTLLAGTHPLFATYAGDASFAPSQSLTSTVTEQVVVTNFALNGNIPGLAGVQRSMIDSAVYTFSEPVNAGANAFNIAIDSGQTGTLPTLTWTAVNPATDGSSAQWAITFGGNGVVAGSIADGVYDLTMNAAAISSDSAPAVKSQARAADTFARLFGDSDGDGSVSIIDFNAFAQIFGFSSTTPGYNGAFDSDGDNSISIVDFNAFASRFGETIYKPVVVNTVIPASKPATATITPATKSTAKKKATTPKKKTTLIKSKSAQIKTSSKAH